MGDLTPKNVSDFHMLEKALLNTQVVYSTHSTGMGRHQHPCYYEMRDILGMYYMK